jgi:hypothetical protein
VRRCYLGPFGVLRDEGGEVWLAEGREGTGEEGHTLPSCTGSVSDMIVVYKKDTHAQDNARGAARWRAAEIAAIAGVWQ